MSFDTPRISLVRRLAQGTSGDYSTVAAAMADVASWTILKVGPGTFTFDTLSLPAGKCIEGDDRDRCILQTTNNTLDAAVVSVGNGSTLRNFYLRGAAAGANRIRLISFAAATAGQSVILDNMRMDNGGGTQPYYIYSPATASNCWFDVYTSYRWFLDSVGPNTFQNCYFRRMDANALYYIYNNTTHNFDSCIFERATGANALIFLISGSVVWRFASCNFVNYSGLASFDSNGAGTVYMAGCDLGGVILNSTTAAVVWYLQGNTNYGNPASTSTATSFKQIDPGLTRSVTATPATLYGWENYVNVDSPAATAITLPACANFGPPYLVVYDSGGHADQYPITLTCAGTDTFAASNTTTDVINEKYGWRMYQKNEAANPDQWVCCASSKPGKPDFQGNAQTMGALQRGWLSSDGSASLKAEAALGLVTSSATALVPGVDANGQYLQHQTGGVANDRAYFYCGANNGPLAAAANWDLTFRFMITAQSNDIRFACGASGSGAATTVPFDSNTPDAPCALVIKETGGTQAKLWVKNTTGGAAGDSANFATWTPAANTYYMIIMRKRGTIVTATVYTDAGVFIDQAQVDELIVATADLRVTGGIRDTGGAAGRHCNVYGVESRQLPSTRTDL